MFDDGRTANGPPKRLYGKYVKSSPCDANDTAKINRVRYHGVPCPLKKTSIFSETSSPPIDHFLAGHFTEIRRGGQNLTGRESVQDR